MSAIIAAPSDGTGILRRAGVLMLVAGLGAVASTGLGEFALSLEPPPDSIGGPGILVALVAAGIGLVASLAYVAVFIVIWVWNAGFKVELILLAAAAGELLGLGSAFVADDSIVVFGHEFVALLVALAGFYVWRQRIFLPLGSAVFFLATVVPFVAAVVFALSSPTIGLSEGLRYLTASCNVVCGLAMIRGARSRAKLISEGPLER